MANPLATSPALTAGEPNIYGGPTVNKKKSGFQANSSTPKPKKVTVKKHTRTVTPKAPKVPVANPDMALINAAVRLRYGPQEQALKGQLGQNARYTSGLNDWYKNALDEIRGLQAQGQATAQQTLGQIQNYNSPATLANPADQQAANARNNLNAEFANQFGRDETANSDAMNRLVAAYGIQQGNTQNQANVDRLRLIAQQGQLGTEKADYATNYGADLQSARAKAEADDLKTQLAAQALGLKVDTLNKVQIPLANSLSKDRSAGQKVARTNARTQRANAREKARQDDAANALGRDRLTLDQWKATHPNAGKKDAGSNSTYSKSKIQGFRSNWEYARATAHQLKDKKSYTNKQGKTQTITPDVAYSALLNATKDPDIARAAALAAFGKTIPDDLVHRLAVKGIHPPAYRAPTIKGGGPYGTGHMEN